MDANTRLTVELPQEVADAVRARVASGAYRTESEVVADGLALLAEQDQPLEAWLATELATGYDAWKADPENVSALDVAAARLDEQSAGRHPRR